MRWPEPQYIVTVVKSIHRPTFNSDMKSGQTVGL